VLEHGLLVDYQAMDAEDERWQKARESVTRRWRAALKCVEARDEGGALAIANSMDEFCQEALRARSAAAGGDAPREFRCRYCPPFAASGGCLGFVGALNHLVLSGQWEEAKQLVEAHLRELNPAGG
jgi:hypothetical protein